MSLFPDVAAFEAALIDLPRMDEATLFDARARQAQLTKPAGSLGRLEEIALFMAGWQGTERPRTERVKAALFAGNHGVAARGVSAFPIEVTAQMVANFQAGGAAINALAGGCGAELSVIPLDLDRPTGDIAIEPAMSEAECLAALNTGAAQAPPDADLQAADHGDGAERQDEKGHAHLDMALAGPGRSGSLRRIRCRHPLPLTELRQDVEPHQLVEARKPASFIRSW